MNQDKQIRFVTTIRESIQDMIEYWLHVQRAMLTQLI